VRRPARKEPIRPAASRGRGRRALSVAFPPVSRHRIVRRGQIPHAREHVALKGPVAHPRVAVPPQLCSWLSIHRLRRPRATATGRVKRDQRRYLLAGASRCPAPAMFICSKPYTVASLPANLCMVQKGMPQYNSKLQSFNNLHAARQSDFCTTRTPNSWLTQPTSLKEILQIECSSVETRVIKCLP